MLQVRIYPRATQNVEQILSWLSRRSPLGAKHWFDKYLDMLRRLPEVAENCSLAPEASMFGPEIRQVLFKTRKGHTYRSLFVIKGDTIHVFAIRGAGQDLLTPDDFDLTV